MESYKETLRRVWISERSDACQELDWAALHRIIAQVDADIAGLSEERARDLL